MDFLKRLSDRSPLSHTQLAQSQLKQEYGYVDIRLLAVAQRLSRNGAPSVLAHGRIDGRVVALAVETGRTWRQQTPAELPFALFGGRGCIRGHGADSDRLLQPIARSTALQQRQ